MKYLAGVDYRNIIDKVKNENTNEVETPFGTTKLVYGTNLIAAELSMLLTMPKNSLFFGNDIGLDLEQYQYVTNNSALFNLIKRDIENLFYKYGRAQLREVLIRFNTDINEIEIEITAAPNNSLKDTFSITRNLIL